MASKNIEYRLNRKVGLPNLYRFPVLTLRSFKVFGRFIASQLSTLKRRRLITLKPAKPHRTIL